VDGFWKLPSKARVERPSVISVIQRVTYVVITLSALSMIALIVMEKYNEHSIRTEQMRASHTAELEALTRREVDRLIQSVQERRSNTRDEARKKARQRVYQAYAIAENIYLTYKDSKPRDEILDLVLSALSSVRFDEGHGYYFVNSLDGTILLVAARPDVQGKHYSTLLSKDEQAVIAASIAIVEKQQEGYFEYDWTMPGWRGLSHKKISFVKLFEPFNAVIGTGLYLEDVEKDARRELLKEISGIKYGENGYFFVNTLKGEVIAHGEQPEMVGTSIWAYEDARGNKVFQELLKAAQNPEGAFSFYWWRMPETGEERPKLAFARAIPEWNWLIGTGLYQDQVESEINDFEKQLLRETMHDLVVILIVAIIIIAIVYLSFAKLFRALRMDFDFLEKCFSSAAQKDLEINEETVKFNEFLRIAESANFMLHEKAEARQRLDDEKQQLFVTLQSIADAVIALDQNHKVTLFNPVAEKVTGISEEYAIGKTLPEVLHFVDEHTGEAKAFPVLVSAEELSLQQYSRDERLTSKSGERYDVKITVSPIINRDGEAHGTIIVLRDETEERTKAEEIENLAYYDSLTGLPNRALFLDRLQQAILKAKRNATIIAVLFIDLDNFKELNDTRGHKTGDEFLRRVAERLKGVVRESDTLARLGGDEFTLCLPDFENVYTASTIAAETGEKIINCISSLPGLCEIPDEISASIGIAFYPQDGGTLDELLMHADAAMYQAKSQGKNRVNLYSQELDDLKQQRAQMIREMDEALRDQDFFLFYQPIASLENGRIIACEALIRWQHKEKGLVAPDEFIPLAEETGQINQMGLWVLDTALSQLRLWHDDGHTELQISINLSVAQLKQQSFCATLFQTVSKHNVCPGMISLEITETVMLTDAHIVTAALNEIKEMGFKISLDDFGTGYSSMKYVKYFPVDTLKIDSSFVREMLDSDEDKAIVTATLALASSLGIKTVAEGVETVDQKSFLRENGCDLMQGYLLARPLPPAEFADLLKSVNN
jgi:diguanylate cyclase (GGDEF)-like protein/PAS domain S-box-containing protein